MDKILEAIKSMKVGDYIVIILNIIIVLFVLILVIKKIKNNKRINEIKDSVIEEEVLYEPIQEEIKEEKETIQEEVINDYEVSEMKSIKVIRKEPVKIDRVKELNIEVEYNSSSPFEKTRILLPNKKEYYLGKGWVNLFKRIRRNEVFKDVVWPYVYESYTSKDVTPAIDNLFKPFEYCDPYHTKVVFVNKQPALTVQEDGLAFSSCEMAKKTQIFEELYKEACRDRNVRAIKTFESSLEKYAEQGVFLYNYILTNSQGETKKHEALGWNEFSNAVIKELAKESSPKVFVLFGNLVNNSLKEMLNKYPQHKVVFISSPQKINGSNLFSEINTFLVENNIEPINWSLGKIRK